MTEKQAITQLTTTLALDSDQVKELVELAKRNSSIYKDLASKGKTGGEIEGEANRS